MAKSIFSDKQKFVQSLVKMYPQLQPSRDELEFGYKVSIFFLWNTVREMSKKL
jgi:hypothetical protein